MISRLQKTALLFLVLTFALFTAHASAQMELGLTSDRFTYLLYEPIDLHLTLQNDAGFDLVFQDTPTHPWLTFLVTRADHSAVQPDRSIAGKELKLPDGQSVTLDVDLTPLYSMRETGPYKVQAVVDVGGREYLSEAIQLTLVNGHRVWSETRNVEGSPRIYSLVRFSPSMKGTYLYLKVEDATQNLVYANNRLGEIVDLETPQTLFDNEGQLHILHQAGNSVYRYTRAGADGAILSQSLYDSLDNSQPTLVQANGGGVIISGGRQENDSTRRERLSEVQSHIEQKHETIGPILSTNAPNALMPSAPNGAPPLPPSGSNK